MYFEHFGLKKNPFLLSTTADSLYYARSHSEVMAHLLYGLRQSNGISLLLGAPGTGKTTLLRSLLSILRSTQIVPSIILTPMMETAAEVLQQVLAGFNVDLGQRPASESFSALQVLVRDLASQGKQPLLIIDEAQRLNPAVLDCLRLISTLESDGQQLVRLLLVGQPELARTLAAETMTALRQRISIRCRLGALQFEEVWKYLALRVASAGGDDRMVFRPDAVDALAVYSAGVPRIINLLADHSLIAAYGDRAEVVDGDLVCIVARQMEIALDQSMHNRALQRSCPGEFSPEVWRSTVDGYRQHKTPEPLRRFAETLLPRKTFTPAAATQITTPESL